MCINQHSCCAPCLAQLLKNDANKHVNCPHCSQPVNKKSVVKNRYLITIYELIEAYKNYVKDMQAELESLRKLTSITPKASLLNKQVKMVNSFILMEKSDKNIRESTLFDDFPTSKSQTWVGLP